MKNFINIIVKHEEKGQRIDSFVSSKNDTLSRTRIKNLILKRKLKLNNIVIDDPSKKIISGDRINIEIPEPEKPSLKPYDYKLDINYEDSDNIIINTP